MKLKRCKQSSEDVNLLRELPSLIIPKVPSNLTPKFRDFSCWDHSLLGPFSAGTFPCWDLPFTAGPFFSLLHCVQLQCPKGSLLGSCTPHPGRPGFLSGSILHFPWQSFRCLIPCTFIHSTVTQKGATKEDPILDFCSLTIYSSAILTLPPESLTPICLSTSILLAGSTHSSPQLSTRSLISSSCCVSVSTQLAGLIHLLALCYPKGCQFMVSCLGLSARVQSAFQSRSQYAVRESC